MSEEKNLSSLAIEETLESNPEENKDVKDTVLVDKKTKGARSPRKSRTRGRRDEPREFDEEVLDIARVTRVVKGGRRMRFRATVAIGNKKGKVGIGTGKSVEVATAVKKAVADAKKRLIYVPLVNGTVPHGKKVKYKSARLLVMPAPSGTGVIAGGAFRKVVSLAGVTDILAKSHGTNTPLVSAQAAIKALSHFSPFVAKKKEKGLQ